MLKPYLTELVQTALKTGAATLGGLAEVPQNGNADWQAVLEGVRVEQPRHKEHGDYAVNVSYLARWAKLPPPKISETLLQALAQQPALQTGLLSASAITGFVNFSLSNRCLAETLAQLVQVEKPGQNNRLNTERVLLEYVSANPTGPLHIGHGRWAALGDAAANLLQHCGAEVTREFYVNDAGNQMANIANTLWYRCLEVLGKGTLPAPVEGEPYPFYPGDYVKVLAEEYLADPVRREQILKQVETQTACSDLAPLKRFAQERMLADQRALLDRVRAPFDVWTLESALHQSGRVEKTLERLKASGYTYEQEGALWFKSSAFGDEKDRVLVKSDGSYTYLTADIAYHDEKFTRLKNNQPAFNRVINIWGADHHGYMARMRAAIQALGHPVDQFEIVLGQLVNLIVGGEKTRMGKRKKMLTLEDVVDEVGVDGTRFWMVLRSADTALDFDVDLAASASDENPVFYAQYAHARCASILRNATEAALNVESGESVPPRVTLEQLAQYQEKLTPETLVADLLEPLQDASTSDQALEAIRSLILQLDSFEDRVLEAALQRAPHSIARYALDLAATFHSFYAVCRVLTDTNRHTLARLMVIVALKKTLAQTLALLGVSAPEKM